MLRRVAGTMLAAGLMFAAHAEMARPGTVNYIEGQVALDGRTIAAGQSGKTTAGPGQVLSTTGGKAEMLLTPGVFLRLSDNSAVRMVSPTITNTRVELLKGDAMLEADQIQKENRLAVLDGGVSTLIDKHGVYEFRANQPMVEVFDGQAKVQENDRTVDVGKGKELMLGQATPKPEKFDRNSAESTDDQYAWSNLRSEYVSEANAELAQTFVGGAPGWYGAGWYWDPYFDSWAFMPGAGFLYSPFGWGFYSPAYWGVWGGGYYGGFYPYHRGFIGRGGYRYVPRANVGRGFAGRGVAGPGLSGRSFAPAPRSTFGGGMRMGGGGFGVHMGGGRR